MQPSDGQSISDLAKHADQGFFWSAIGWVIAGLTTVSITLIGYIGIRETRRTSALFVWKDKVVDPALRDLPKDYVMKADLHALVVTPNAADHTDIKGHLVRVEEKLDQLLLK